MATPMTDSQFLAAMRAEGCKLDPQSGFGSHDRNGVGPWGPINGVLIHHTGSDTSSASASTYNRNILWSGYSGLPGPLCHVGVAPNGTLYVNSNGRANHAGGGDQAVLDAAASEASWLSSREAKPSRGNSNGVDGNRHFYGAEIMYSGGHAMSAEQYDQSVRFAAAICRHYGWSARSVIGHREWSADKIDPGRCPMVTFRAAVQVRLNNAANWSPGTVTKPAAPAPKPTTTGTGAGGAGGGLPKPAAKPKPSSYPKPNDRVVYDSKVKPGQQNSDSVYWVQVALNAISLKGGREIPLTGDYDALTVAEVKKFQTQKCKDPADGDLGPKQTRYLFDLAKINVTHKEKP